MVTSFCKKDVIAQNMQNVISKYSKAVPIPSRNVRSAGFSRFDSLYQRYTLHVICSREHIYWLYFI